MKRERLIAAATALLGVCLAAGWLLYDYRARPRIVTGPMVQMLTPTGCVLVWQMHPAGRIEVTLDAVIEQRRITATPVTANRYELTLSELQPDQTYRYQIGDLLRSSFRTAPAQPRPFRLIAIGDTGDGEATQWRVARMMPRYSPDLIVHTGDLIYPSGDLADYPGHFFRPYAAMIEHIPFYPCLGNHDVKGVAGASPLLETFVLPRNGPAASAPEREYWFDYSGVRFAVLDSNTGLEHLRDVVAPWLDGVFADTASMWKIVYFHEPIYTHGKYAEAGKLHDSIVPVLDRRSVNLVLCGHNHMYERTQPLRGDRIVREGEGTVYVTTGAGGARLYDFKPDPPAYMARWNDAQHGFTVIEVSPDVMHVRQVGEEDPNIDDFFIPRGERSAPATTAPASRSVTLRERGDKRALSAALSLE